MTDDAALLRRYARENSQEAFAELVRRRIDLVYAVALRKVGGDTHLAEDVSQRVFADVARKAALLAEHPAFSGWLFQSTHYAATQLVRSERRRRARETKADSMKTLWPDDEAHVGDGKQLRPLLDDLINQLNERDRAAIIGRFFEALSLAEVGRRLGLSDAGAQSRVERAVEKLRSALARRGVTSTSAAVGLALASQAGAAAPVGLAASVATAALAGAGAATAASGLVIFMSATKAAFGGSLGLSAAGVLLFTSIGFSLFEVRSSRAAETEWALAHHRLAAQEATLAQVESARTAAQDRLTTAIKRATESRAALASPAATEGKLSSGGVAGEVPRRDPRADGRAFLAGLDEAGRKAFAEAMRGQFQTAYAAMIREAGLTPAQVSALGARLVQHWLDHLVVTPGDISPDPEDDELSDDEMRSLLGAETFARWELAGRKNPAYEWAQGLALRIQRDAESTPLTPGQVGDLAESVVHHSPDFRSGGVIDLAGVEWAAVAAEVRPQLAAAQWRQAEQWLLKQELEHEFSRRKSPDKP